MEILKVSNKKSLNSDIARAVNFFLIGKTIVYPTDTIYGLGCLATDIKAIKKLDRIKNRSKGKSYIVLIKSYCMLKDYFQVSKAQVEYLRKIWVPDTRPGFERKFSREITTPNLYFKKKDKDKAVTVILYPKKGIFPKDILASDGSLAVRLPKSEFLIKILKRVNQPIISTSFNVSGEKPINNPRDINELKKLPDLVIDVGVIKGKPSTLIDIRDIENIKIIRK